MRKIGANYIITNTGKALRNAYLEINQDGKILRLVEPDGDLQEVNQLEFYNGVLVPGFVNTHAHLELSFLKNKIEKGKGLAHFIKNLREQRISVTEEEIQQAIFEANDEMQREGIVLVGDISNSEDSISTKI